MAPRFGYTPPEADQAKVRIENHLRFAKHHVDCLRRAVSGGGSIPAPLDDIEAKLEEVANELCDLVDERTEVGV